MELRQCTDLVLIARLVEDLDAAVILILPRRDAIIIGGTTKNLLFTPSKSRSFSRKAGSG
jgi:hypothetical protein